MTQDLKHRLCGLGDIAGMITSDTFHRMVHSTTPNDDLSLLLSVNVKSVESVLACRQSLNGYMHTYIHTTATTHHFTAIIQVNLH